MNSARLPALFVAGLVLAVLAVPADAATLHVPEDHAAIQVAVLAAEPGDTVLVAPGRYRELIRMKDGVVLRSADGPDSTILVSPGLGEKVIEERLFEIPEGCGRSTVIEGFTLDADGLSGCAIYVEKASPTIRGNVIDGFGWGVHLQFADALIEDNVFRSCVSFGILARASSPEIYRNTLDSCKPVGISVSGKDARPIIGGSPENKNKIFGSFLALRLETRNDVDATWNDWGWETAAEMDRKGYPADIIAIVDGRDEDGSPDMGLVDYRNWVTAAVTVPEESPGAPGPIAWVLIAGGLVAVFVGISRRRKTPAA